MKKIIGMGLALLLCLSVLGLTVYAAEPTAYMTGPGTVRAGDTITINYQFTGEGIVTVMGTLNYDPAQLTPVAVEQKVSSFWDISSNGNLYVIEDSKFSDPINSEVTLISFTFLVADLPEGTEVNVSFTGVSATTLSEEHTVADAAYSVSISRPLHTDNTLGGLTVNNATISPAFDPSLTRYTTQVPFDVTELDLIASPADDFAHVSVSNPALAAGTTTEVTITVTAENGSTKTYTILVTRDKDPNYEPSDNNYLSDIKVEEFRLSPVFDKDVTDYLIWLPYEVDRVILTGIAEDRFATVIVEGGNNLVAGADNEIRVICTAENGDQRVYTVIAKRAPAHGSQPTDPTRPTTTPSAPNQPSSTPTQSFTRPTNPGSSEPDDDGSKLMLVVYLLLGAIALGGIVVCVLFILGTKKQGKFSK